MGRNKKLRRIAHRPPVTVFKPAGVPAQALQWLRLPLDAYEALRLADYEGLSQEETAERLGVSRPTAKTVKAKLASGIAPGRRAYMAYLPLYNGVESLEIGVPADAAFEPLPRMAELLARGADVVDQPLRLGGQVKPGSLDWNPETRDLRFVVQDSLQEVRVHSTGAPPASTRCSHQSRP